MLPGSEFPYTLSVVNPYQSIPKHVPFSGPCGFYWVPHLFAFTRTCVESSSMSTLCQYDLEYSLCPLEHFVFSRDVSLQHVSSYPQCSLNECVCFWHSTEWNFELLLTFWYLWGCFQTELWGHLPWSRTWGLLPSLICQLEGNLCIHTWLTLKEFTVKLTPSLKSLLGAVLGFYCCDEYHDQGIL